MTYGARRDWFQIVGLLLLLVAMWFATSCASAPPAPTRQLPPAEAWPFCAMKCAEEGQLFIGLVIVDPAGQQVGCGCAQKPAATPQTFWGPT